MKTIGISCGQPNRIALHYDAWNCSLSICTVANYRFRRGRSLVEGCLNGTLSLHARLGRGVEWVDFPILRIEKFDLCRSRVARLVER